MDERIPFYPEGPSVSAEIDLRLDGFLPFRLDILAEAINQALGDLIADRFELGLPEWRVLTTLGEHRSITAKDIGLLSRMHKTKVSRAVASLETKGLVARQLNRADLREAFLSLTPKGRKVHQDLTPLVLELEHRLASALTADDRSALDRILTKLTAQADAVVSAPPGG